MWVIAETSDLPTRFAKIVVTDDRGRYLMPDLPKANYDVWVRGYGWSIRRRSRRARQEAEPHRGGGAQSARRGAILSGRLLAVADPGARRRASFREPARTETASAGDEESGANGSAACKSGGCTGVPCARQQGDPGDSRGARHVPFRSTPGTGASSPARPAADERRAQRFGTQARARGCSRTGPTASPKARCRRRRPVRKASSATSSSPSGTWPSPRSICTTWCPPTGAIRASMPTVRSTVRSSSAPTICRCSIRRPTPASKVPLTVRDPEHAADVARRCRSRRRTGAKNRSGRARPTSTIRCSTARAGSGSRPRCGRRPIPTSARRARAIRRPSCFRWPTRGRQLAVYDPKTKKLTHISTCFSTHHLMFAEDANNTLWTERRRRRCVGWLNTKMFDETHDEVKSQGWTPFILDTNGNGKRDAYVEPNQPVDPTKDKRIAAACTPSSPAPDGSVWGTVLGFPARSSASCPAESARDRARRILRAAVERSEGAGPWLLAARRRRRSQRRRLGGAGQRPHGELRSPQVQGPLNGPTATGQHCPEGWTLYQEPLPQLQGRHDSGQRRGQLLHLGRSVRHVRPRARTCRSTPATRPKGCWR